MPITITPGEEVGFVADLQPARQAVNCAERSYLALSTLMEVKFPFLPGIPAFFSQLARDADLDQESIQNFNRRFVRLPPNDDETASTPPAPYRESQPESFIHERFAELPTPQGAFDLAADVELHVLRFFDNLKDQLIFFNDHEAFSFIANLQQRIWNRFEKNDCFARRLSDPTNIASMVIVDTYMESYIR